ncbi:type II secretion system secretin GspD [Acinetobacter soli]|uniref:type II secretion system secretin GspD n=1 Tax=Acinetobacter soli TaxID=487316 RepID=UPI000CE3CE9C|nr:type II secretion system secretin GspD [Acinetobacter soli]PPB85575.1 type II secretion system protein GspD [Acinetobacter soli]WEI12619.1 type II secretion system secretin GspD [Acinetobacter soli]WEI14326.1 type II secretion system secretin GspD [Acinetobacter soli]
MALFNHRPLWALVAAAPVMAVISTSTYAQTWKINLRDADLTAFINEVADITGKNFAVDPRVRGNVTVISNKPLTRDEVYDLFLGVLNVNGVVAIPSGNTIKLVPDSNVKNAGLPYDMRNRARGDQVVTRVIWVENTNPNDLIPALRPLMPQFASLAAVPGTNALIVSDRAANIAQLETIIRNLDGTGQNDVEAITLQNSQAEEMVGLLESISSTGASKDVTGSRVRIIADARTNRILIKGDTGTRKRIRNMIETLDVPSADRLGGLKVFRLKYASAKNLAEILQGLVSGQAVNSSQSKTGSNSGSSSSTGLNSLIGGSASQSNTTGSNNAASGSSINLNSSNNANNQNSITSFNNNGVSIIADSAQNALVVKAEPQLMREIESAIQQLDIRREQVLIEAAIIEVSGDDADQLGIQWALGDLSSGIGLISFSNVGASLASIAAGYLSNGSTGAASAIASGSNGGSGATLALGNFSNSRKAYGALIQALKTNTKSNLLSTPSIVTMDNEEAYIVVGQNVPFVTGSVSTTSTGVANPYTTVERKDVGVTLKVIPHIGENGTVRLEVEQEVSAVQDKGQATDLITSKRAIKTSVLAEHGQTVVLGGLISDNRTLSRQGLPGLSSIPYVGRLFRADSNSNEKRNLLVFIHPTIVGDANDVRRISQQRYNQLYSLQLSMDKNGNFAKLPENLEQLYQQPAAPVAAVPSTRYQQVPATTVTTPVATVRPSSPVVRKGTSYALPVQPTVNTQSLNEPEVERTKNTVTTTTLRPVS